MDGIVGTWHLVQFTPDLRRREPRNVGLVLRAPDGWHSRFVHTGVGGELDARTARDLPREAYLAWLDYFHRKMNQDRWEDVEHAVARRGGNFAVTLGGHFLATPVDGWETETQRLFASLVGEAHEAEGGRRRLRSVVRDILAKADLDVVQDFKTEAVFGASRGTTTFDFAHQNGQLHLMKALPLGGNSAENRALAFNARVRAARDAHAAESFFAFFDASVVEDFSVLVPVEGVASVVDVSNEWRAIEQLRDTIGSH